MRWGMVMVRHRAGHGFTLLELMVVMAVISVLSAVTLPVLLRARQQAMASSCRSNMKQLGMAFMMYANDYKGFLPHEDAGTSIPPSGCCWFDVLDPYLDGGEAGDVKQCPAAVREDDWHTIKMNSSLEQDNRGIYFYKLGATPRESRTVLLFDGRVDYLPGAYLTKGTPGVGAMPHGGGAMVLCLDGHVELYYPSGVGTGWGEQGPFVWDPYP